jgi:hypothetical protein
MSGSVSQRLKEEAARGTRRSHVHHMASQDVHIPSGRASWLETETRAPDS